MATHTDPVCGMKVDDQKAGAKSMSGGETVYFCSSDCKGKFDANPQKYPGQKAAGCC